MSAAIGGGRTPGIAALILGLERCEESDIQETRIVKKYFRLCPAHARLDIGTRPIQDGPQLPAISSQAEPDWVKIIDHGQYDPRLKGYFASRGLADRQSSPDAPDVINPVGMTFAADGTLLRP